MFTATQSAPKTELGACRGKPADHGLAGVNCAAIPVGLLQSELFGHERGALDPFSAAASLYRTSRQRAVLPGISSAVDVSGIFDDGELFLISDLPMESQLPFFSGRGSDFDEEQMLRITRKGNGEVVFKVSGQLNIENLAEMEKLMGGEKKGGRTVLDLTDLISVDGEAVKFLAKCEADSIKLKNCSGYIREWIRRERLRTDSDNSSER